MSFFARDRKPPTNGYVTQLHKLWDGSVGQIKKRRILKRMRLSLFI